MIAAAVLAGVTLASAVDPEIATHAATAAFTADGKIHVIAFSRFAAAPDGSDLGLYADDVSVVSGDCEAGWDTGGVAVRSSKIGDCVVSALPHDLATSAVAETPATVTVMFTPPSVAGSGSGSSSSTTRASTSSITPDADPVLPVVAAGAVVLFGGQFAVRAHRRQTERSYR